MSPSVGCLCCLSVFYGEGNAPGAETYYYRFPPDREGHKWEVEYRSASRIGDSDFDINRKRIKAIRLELQKKGWTSTGYA